MAHKRGRRLAIAAAGLAAAAPFLIGQQVAGAAVTSAAENKRLTFVDDNGQTLTCDVGVNGLHDTDDRGQPKLFWGGSRIGSGCFDIAFTDVTVTYKDSEGVGRTLRFGTYDDVPSGSVTGAYNFTTCDERRSATCTVSLTASPK
jgi:hypothetical protein